MLPFVQQAILGPENLEFLKMHDGVKDFSQKGHMTAFGMLHKAGCVQNFHPRQSVCVRPAAICHSCSTVQGNKRVTLEAATQSPLLLFQLQTDTVTISCPLQKLHGGRGPLFGGTFRLILQLGHNVFQIFQRQQVHRRAIEGFAAAIVIVGEQLIQNCPFGPQFVYVGIQPQFLGAIQIGGTAAMRHKGICRIKFIIPGTGVSGTLTAKGMSALIQ